MDSPGKSSDGSDGFEGGENTQKIDVNSDYDDSKSLLSSIKVKDEDSFLVDADAYNVPEELKPTFEECLNFIRYTSNDKSAVDQQ
jgi:hypothetical protein